MYLRKICQKCKGNGILQCARCRGTGKLVPGGYHKKNYVNIETLVDSKWTAKEKTFGWRHFQVVEKKRRGPKVFALLQATCDESTQFWVICPAGQGVYKWWVQVNSENLRDKSSWSCGWISINEVAQIEPCKICDSLGWIKCPNCFK